MRVLKFGGKSLNSKEKFLNICKYIKQEYQKDNQLIIVVSAIGDTTDELIKTANEYGYSQKSNRELSRFISTGEIQSASLMAMMLISMGLPAQSLSGKDIGLSTFGDYLNSKIAYIDKSKILKVVNSGIIAVVAGFQGFNNNNETTTLGRGGSDTTAVAIASIFDISAEIYSDYNGIFTGDPKYNTYKKIDKLDYDFTYLMASSGAKVLDKRAIAIAKDFKIKIIAKSSSKPNYKGSVVENIENDTLAICKTENLCKISIIFSRNDKMEKISKIVLNTINNYVFYNFECNNNKIEFFIEEKNKLSIYDTLSKKLKLLKE